MAASSWPEGWQGWRWVALLGFGLFAPIHLPAGGGERRLPEVRCRQRAAEPLAATGSLALRCAPQHDAPIITRVDQGAMLRPLRRWCAERGQPWLQVELAAPARQGGSRRGWLSDAEIAEDQAHEAIIV